jgi:YidC/Oxa1 family membrane protein insertase
MKIRHLLIPLLAGYLLLCGYLVLKSGLFSKTPAENGPCILLQQTASSAEPQPESASQADQTTEPLREPPSLTAAETPRQVSFSIDNSAEKTFIIGADDPNTENPDIETNFKLQVTLTNKGAGIEKVTFSNGDGKGFDDRNPKNPKPYVLLNPVKYPDGREQYSMESGNLVFPDYKVQLPLNKLNWDYAGVETAPDGCEKATFVADIKDANSGDVVLKVIKVFDILPNTYVMHCHMSVENLSGTEQKVRFDLKGPLGIGREDARSDMRKVVAAFANSQGQVVSTLLNINKARKAETPEDLELKSNSNQFLWAAITNKYFTAIAVPVPQAGEQYCKWISDKSAQFYNPDGDEEKNSDDETIGIDFSVASHSLAPKGIEGSRVDYKFEIYLGPKDKKLFDDNEYYTKLGFVHTIDFPTCCICPANLIRPLAFFIMWLMNVLYSGIPNYGVVIIILVFVVRLVLHPVTKAGQVRMNRFTKILSAPEVVEIRKKYAKNQMEMQKRISEFQKSRGVSPMDAFWGMLPMMVQMPLWIALWSAVNASIDLRGAPFLPWWITDLSAPDALLTWHTITIPLFFFKAKLSSLNLLPILMGIAFYLQQKTMPQQAAATPEQEQQQKIMKWMMLLMFPLLLYNAPSGVNLYIMASAFAGAIEQYVIRKHIREKEDSESKGMVEVTRKTGGKVKKKKPKPFFRY